MKEKSYTPFMSSGAQKKINDGTWEVMGLTVRERRTGRIVANLKTVTNESESGYTPAMFLALNDQIICSQRLLSEHVRQVYQRLNAGQFRIEDKLDLMIDTNFGALQGEIFYHFSRFETLRTDNSDAAERFLESAGLLASRLSGMIDPLVKNYLDQVEVTSGSQTMKYSEYLATPMNERLYMSVRALKYPAFNNTWCHILIDGLIELFNELNIVSVCFNQELFMGYRTSLEALHGKLFSLLDNLVRGVKLYEMSSSSPNRHTFHDYRFQVFSRDTNGEWIRENEAERLEKYWDSFNRDNLAVTDFPRAENSFENPIRDPELYQAVSLVLDLMDKISDLLCRSEQLEEGGIDDTEALQLLAEKIFRAPKSIPAP
ncbi:hypothetical protein [Enterobacter genomosp. O]|uniref:Uncharacterized protein n=1 Tax=Enterobacter genomosp. O TaxID=2364150 RepID=A0A0X4ET62_9ENTR|nr:hypothetical protein [Enterobacter genomosp. O]KUQ84832.1 hypothetical protein AWI28_15200 [Enterobacter genomosp. O]